jgi:hypothetical protein
MLGLVYTVSGKTIVHPEGWLVVVGALSGLQAPGTT